MATAIILWVNGSLASPLRPVAVDAASRRLRVETHGRCDVARPAWNSCAIGCRGPSSSPAAPASSLCLSPGERSTTGASSCGSSIRCRYGANDPLYDKDIGFYLFSLPAYVVIKNWMLLTLFLSALFAGAIYWVHGDIEYDAQRRSMSPTAIAHGSVLLGFFFAVKAWSYGLDRYLLLYGDNGVVVGASYTDIHVELPVLWLLIGLSIVAAFAAWANLRVRTYRLPAAAAAARLRRLLRAVRRGPRIIPARVRQTERAATGEALHRTQHRADPAGLQSPSDRGEAVSRRTEPHLQDTRGQQGDHRQYKAVGLAAADGYLRAAAGDPHLLQIP